MKVFLLLFPIIASSLARPEIGIEKKFETSREISAQQLTPLIDSAHLPLEGRDNGEIKTLAYYGGALGQYLVIHPSGHMYITGQRRVPTGIRDEDEEDVGVAEEEPSDNNDSVSVNQPPENASVAEAKPVGVSIAGEGGVASAQPIAQAIVGPGGLALTRPIATAIAGVPGAENLVIGPGKLPAVRNYAFLHPHTYIIYPAATYPAVTY